MIPDQNIPIQLVGIPFDAYSSYMRGPAQAPMHIRGELFNPAYNPFSESVTDVLSERILKDCGDLNLADYQDISGNAVQYLKQGRCLFLGGDHSISFPLLEGVHERYGPVDILHLDAHGDLYDSLGGNQFSHACPFARIMENGLAQSLTQVGIRTITAHQQEQAEKFGVEVYTMKEIEAFDPSNLSGPLYISIDIDVLDPAFAPGVSHREAGGVSSRQLIAWLQGIRQPIISADLVEYNPLRDGNGITASLCAKLVKEMLDAMLRNPLE